MANPERRMERGLTPVGPGSSKGLRVAGRSRLLLPMMGRLRPRLRGNTRWGRGRWRRRSRRKADPSYHPQKARVRDDNDKTTTKKREKQIPHPSQCDGIRNDNK